jgi:hypothetical protein
MMRALFFMLLSSSAFAAEGPYETVNLEALPEVHDVVKSDQGEVWRAGLQSGGFVRVERFASAEEAESMQTFRSRSLVNVDAPTDASYQLVRDENILISVRSHAGDAVEMIERVRGVLSR